MTQEELEQKQKEKERFELGNKLYDDILFVEHALYCLMRIEEYRREKSVLPPVTNITVKAYMNVDKKTPIWEMNLFRDDNSEPILERIQKDLEDKLLILKKRFEEL